MVFYIYSIPWERQSHVLVSRAFQRRSEPLGFCWGAMNSPLKLQIKKRIPPHLALVLNYREVRRMGNKKQNLSSPGYQLVLPGGLRGRLDVLPSTAVHHPEYSPLVAVEAVVACLINLIEHPANICIQLRSLNVDVHFK